MNYKTLIPICLILTGCGSAVEETTSSTLTSSPEAEATPVAPVVYPDPDDFFDESSLNSQRWTSSVTTGTLEITGADVLRWQESTADPTAASMTTRYTVDDSAFNIDVDLTINSVSLNESAVEVRLFFNSSDTSCDYISLKLERTAGGVNQLRMYRCDGGSTINSNTIASPGYSMSVRLERDPSNGRVRFYYDTGSGYNILGTISTGMTANTTYFNNSARPTIYFMNPNTGTVEVEIDNWDINGATCTWDY